MIADYIWMLGWDLDEMKIWNRDEMDIRGIWKLADLARYLRQNNNCC